MESGRKFEGAWTMRIERKKTWIEKLAGVKFLPLGTRQAFILAAMLLPALFQWGCAGIVGQSTQQAPPPPPTYSLSGTITPAAGGNGTMVTLSGAASASSMANSSGAFSFLGLKNGTYTLTPSRTGYTFSPTSQNVTVNGATVTGVSFTATQQVNPTYSISGTITPTAGGNGATVTLSGTANGSTTANSSGAFTFSGLANGSYTLTPSRTGYTFSPTSQNVTVSGAAVSGVSFTATQQVNPTYSISGTISPTAGGSGAKVTLNGAASATTTANTSGNYTFTGLSNGTYAVTPSLAGYTFSPTSQSATVNGANVTGVNFTATVQVNPTFSISGTISPTAGGSGATVTLSGTASGSTTSNGSGVYTFTGLANGSYTVTPSNSGYTFTPVNQSVTVNGANVGSVNFTAAVQQAHSATLSWTASTSTVSGYNVYRGTVNGGPYTLINTSLLTALSFMDTNVTSGATYYYVTTAVDSSGNESVDSNQVTAVIP
jgi:hypothetical protein